MFKLTVVALVTHNGRLRTIGQSRGVISLVAKLKLLSQGGGRKLNGGACASLWRPMSTSVLIIGVPKSTPRYSKVPRGTLGYPKQCMSTGASN